MYCEDSGQFVIFRLRNPKIRTTQEWVGRINLLRITKPSFFLCVYFFTRQWKRWKWKQVQTSASNKNQTALEQDTAFLFPWGKKTQIPSYQQHAHENEPTLRGCLVPKMKNFGCQIDCLTRCREGFSDTNFKTHMETARRIFWDIWPHH